MWGHLRFSFQSVDLSSTSGRAKIAPGGVLSQEQLAGQRRAVPTQAPSFRETGNAPVSGWEGGSGDGIQTRFIGTAVASTGFAQCRDNDDVFTERSNHRQSTKLAPKVEAGWARV